MRLTPCAPRCLLERHSRSFSRPLRFCCSSRWYCCRSQCWFFLGRSGGPKSLERFRIADPSIGTRRLRIRGANPTLTQKKAGDFHHRPRSAIFRFRYGFFFLPLTPTWVVIPPVIAVSCSSPCFD